MTDLTPISINELVSQDSPHVKRQAAVNRLLGLSHCQALLNQQIAGEAPAFGIGDPAQGGIRFEGQDARDLLAASLHVITVKADAIRKELEGMGVKFDAPNTPAPVLANRRARRAAKAGK